MTSERDRCAFYAYKNVTIAVWMGQADLAAAKAAERAAGIMATRHRAGRSYVAFILDGVAGPTPEASEIFTKVMGQRETLACIAHVIEGSGFWASALRSLVSNLYRDSGASGRFKVGTSVDDVANWLSPKHLEATGTAVPAPELRDALLQARRLCDPR